MALIKINGRSHFIDRDTVEIAVISNGRWEITLDGDYKFIVVGGRKSGGASNEWFCHCPRLFGEEWVACKSMVEAIKLGASF